MKKFIPFPYQTYCIGRLISQQALGLFLDMGLGKTVITLTAINDLKYNRFEINKVLVIAPKKVAERTWNREAESWEHLQNLRILPVLGTAQQRIRKLNTPADIFVINRENVVWLVEYYRNAWPFDMVVIDESSSFKSHQAKRFKALTWVRNHMKRIVELTGTPAPNGLTDLWAQIFLLDQGHRLGTTVGAFREHYCEPDKRTRDQIYSYTAKPGADEVVHRLISDICISLKAEDYLELPELITDIVPVALDAKAKKAYDEMERDMLLRVDETVIDAGSAAVLTGKLLQLCNGALYDESKKVVDIHDCKIQAFMETVERLNGQPALVFYNFRHDLERIKKALSSCGLRVRELKTAEDEEAWNKREIDILLAHPASAGYGLNLQHGGNHEIWFGLNWSLELFQQAQKRLHRQGQKQTVFVHILIVEEGMDSDVMAALEDKGATQDKLLEALKVRITKIRGGRMRAKKGQERCKIGAIGGCMNKEEQILELASLATEAFNRNREQIYKRIAGGKEDPKNPPTAIAEAIYNAGYRKADEARKERAREIVEKLKAQITEYQKNAAKRSNAGEVIGLQLALQKVNDIAAECSVEVKECEYNFADGDTSDYEAGIAGWISWECSNCGYHHSEDDGEAEEEYNKEEECFSFITSYKYCPMCGLKIKSSRKMKDENL